MWAAEQNGCAFAPAPPLSRALVHAPAYSLLVPMHAFAAGTVYYVSHMKVKHVKARQV